MKLSDMFANDTFHNMGDLVDIESWYAGRDKIQHIICAIFLMLLLPFSIFINSLIILFGGIVLEIIEYVRYNLYGYSKILCDKMSWRDIVANITGMLLGILLRVIN